MIEKRAVSRAIAYNVISKEMAEKLPAFTPPQALTLELYAPGDLGAYQETGRLEHPLAILRLGDEPNHVGFFTLSQLEEIVEVLRAAANRQPS